MRHPPSIYIVGVRVLTSLGGLTIAAHTAQRSKFVVGFLGVFGFMSFALTGALFAMRAQSDITTELTRHFGV